MPAPSTRKFALDRERELDRVVTLRDASQLSTLSEDTIRRRHGDKIVRLSTRRVGMRLRHALALA